MSSRLLQPPRTRTVPAKYLTQAALCALSLGLATPACVRGEAKTRPDVPLNMPAPPPRVVEVSDPASPPIVTLPEEPVHTVPPRPVPAAPQRTEARPPDARPDATDVPRPTDDAARTPQPPTLQTTPAQQEGETERRIRALLAQATGDLNRINVQSLNADARQQFDTARRFVSQANDAIRARNLMFAGNLADKAAALAAQLAGR